MIIIIQKGNAIVLMEKSFKNLIGVALLIGLSSCGTQQPTSTSQEATDTVATEDRPLVVATTSVLCDLTQQIAKETVDLKCLVGAGVDPHVYQPTPEDRKAIDSAKLILYGGYNFDPGLVKLVKATSNPSPKVAVHEIAVPKPLMGEEHDRGHEGEEHTHEHEEGHAEGEKAPDPHVWHNAQNGIAMVKVIAGELERLEPNNASQYQNNAKEITEELTQIDSWIKSEIATIPADKRQLVTTHDALGYYADAYGLIVEGALQGISTDEAPTATRVSNLVKDITKTKVPTIFAETTVNPKLIETVAKESKVQVSDRELYADGIGEKGTDGDTYQKMLIANTQSIVEGLGGKYTPFQPK
ncbi:MAG: zinc ABC transporter substrate-binding protein [Hydrococcus sp. Prado102]|jgi:manganese/iron transport system substrate-binding protein|nr:zinc ABC transporter substrate-binding protein [Hydrococcus sp. Prado102]